MTTSNFHRVIDMTEKKVDENDEKYTVLISSILSENQTQQQQGGRSVMNWTSDIDFDSLVADHKFDELGVYCAAAITLDGIHPMTHLAETLRVAVLNQTDSHVEDLPDYGLGGLSNLHAFSSGYFCFYVGFPIYRTL